MAYAIGTIIQGSGDLAHYQLLDAIKTLAESVGWTTLRYDTSIANRELILKSTGLSGTEEIYIGFQCYQNVSADYYNMHAAVFSGYVAGTAFNSQPGALYFGVPCHNSAITYYMACNKQRIVAGLKVGTPVYEHFYVGKMIPYARPGEYPAPIVCAGETTGFAAIRYSDTTHRMPYTSYRANTNCYMFLRNLDGTYDGGCWAYPYLNRDQDGDALFSTTYQLVPAGTNYQLEPIILCQYASGINASNVWGELDGVYAISGFSNGSENVVQQGGSSVIDQTGMTPSQAVAAIKAVGGRAFVVIQNVYRTTWRDFVALEM